MKTIDLTPTCEQWMNTVMTIALRTPDPAKVIEPVAEDFKNVAKLADAYKTLAESVVSNLTDDLLKKELRKRGYLQVYWHEDDVRSSLKESEHEWTEDDLQEICKLIENLEATEGVDWNTVDLVQDEYFRDKK